MGFRIWGNMPRSGNEPANPKGARRIRLLAGWGEAGAAKSCSRWPSITCRRAGAAVRGAELSAIPEGSWITELLLANEGHSTGRVSRTAEEGPGSSRNAFSENGLLPRDPSKAAAGFWKKDDLTSVRDANRSI